MSLALQYLALWKLGFRPTKNSDYLDFERVRPGIDRLERVTLQTFDGTWYASARAVDLNGDDVCPEWCGGGNTVESCLAALDALPPEYGYHNHDSTPGP